MMKRRTSKSQIRSAMQQEVEDFLNRGGKIDEVAQGLSGRPHPEKAITPAVFNEPSTTRTDISNILHQLDARRRKQPTGVKTHSRRKPKKKLIYDDFGEPLRWVWEQE